MKDYRSQGLRLAEDNPVQFQARVDKLIAAFDGLIKYNDLLKDHWDWSDEQVLKFVKDQHSRAVKQYYNNKETWNEGVPYCRNDMQKAEARGLFERA